MKRLLPFVVLLLLLASCKPSKPSGVISEGKLKNVLVDYHLAQGMAQGTSDPEKNQYIYIQQVFRKHRITEAQFDTTMIYYSIHAEDMAKIYEEVHKRIEANANKLGVDTEVKSKYADLTEEGDTANIWSGLTKSYVLKDNKQENIKTFHMQADSTFRQGDSFLWHFQTTFLKQDDVPCEVYAMLVVEYENDSVVSTSQSTRSDGTLDLNVRPMARQDTLDIKSLTGYLYMPIKDNSEKQGFRMTLVNDLALVRFHKKVEEVEKLPSDTLAADTVEVDTVEQDTHERLTPMQMRDSQPREKTIHVVKEKPVDSRLRPNRNVNGTMRRRKVSR